MDRLVTIKSNRYGMEIRMADDVPFDTLLAHMKEKFESSARFFEGSHLAVSFVGRKLSYTEEETILELFRDITSIDIVCVIDRNAEHELVYRNAVSSTMSGFQKKDGQFYRGTLKKHQVVESDSSIVILGDVELGAKVIARGNVVIVGSLYGSVHAGAYGDDEAYVVALDMRPKQLRIGNIEARRQIIYQESLNIKGAKIATVDAGRIYLDPLVED